LLIFSDDYTNNPDYEPHHDVKAAPRKSYSYSAHSKTKAAADTLSLPPSSPTIRTEGSIIPPYTPRKYDSLSRGVLISGLDPTSIGVSPDVMPGWPFLRKKPTHERKTDAQERSNLSVVQWAMQLPSRYMNVSPSRQNLNFENKMGMFGSNRADFCSKLDRTEVKKLPKELVSLKEKYKSMFTLFSYSELQHITENFAPCIALSLSLSLSLSIADRNRSQLCLGSGSHSC
jgi:hypothetical protein